MKKQLLALSMVATSGLMAQPDAPMHNQSHNQSNSCNTCSCNPCCCTNPRPCVDCECYVPSFYNLQCDWGFNFDAEFLYWYARETNLSYASKIQMLDVDQDATTPQLAFGSNTYKHLDTDWDPGFRLGIGFNSSCDGWDYNLTWTWFQNKRTDSTSVPDYSLEGPNGSFSFLGSEDQFILLNPWINASFHELTQDFPAQPTVLSFDRIQAKYRLRFNQVDLDIGRKYWLSECFNLRPFAGLRGAWTRAKFSTTSTRDFTSISEEATVALKLHDRFKTKAWGVGFIAGLEPTWYFSRCFALYAKAGTGALWGDFEVDKKETYTGTTSIENFDFIFPNWSNTDHSEHAQMTGLLDLALGLRWERTWCCDRYRTAVDLGWEHHIFFDQNHRIKTSDFFQLDTGSAQLATSVSGYRQYDEATGNLGFGGFVLRLNFDF